MNPAHLSLHGVGARFGARWVARDVSLDLQSGEIVGLLGANGSGKTTLLRIAGGVLPASAGEVQYAAQDLRSLSPRARARHRAFVPSAAPLGFPYRVVDVVSMGRAHAQRWFGFTEETQLTQRWLSDLDLPVDLHQPVDDLSTGERQLVLVIRALVQDTPLLLLDEPFAPLDLGHCQRLMHVLQQRASAGTAVLVSLHDPNLAALLCHRVVLLCDGSATQGAPTELMTPEQLEKTFRARVRVGRHPDVPVPAVHLCAP